MTSYLLYSLFLTFCVRVQPATISFLLCLGLSLQGFPIRPLQVELVPEIFRRASQDLPLNAQVQNVNTLVALGLDAVVLHREDVVGGCSKFPPKLLNLM